MADLKALKEIYSDKIPDNIGISRVKPESFLLRLSDYGGVGGCGSGGVELTLCFPDATHALAYLLYSQIPHILEYNTQIRFPDIEWDREHPWFLIWKQLFSRMGQVWS